MKHLRGILCFIGIAILVAFVLPGSRVCGQNWVEYIRQLDTYPGTTGNPAWITDVHASVSPGAPGYWVSGNTITINDRLDNFVLRLDTLGYPIAGVRFGSTRRDTCTFGIPVADGYIMGGQTTVPDSSGRQAMWVAKVDLQLSIVWQKLFDWEDMTLAANGTTDPNGNIYVTGSIDRAGPPTSDLLLVKLAPNGNLIWRKIMGGAGEEAGLSVACAANGAVYVAGYQESGSTDDVLVAKLSPNGNLTWAKRIHDTSGHEQATGIALKPNGQAFVCGIHSIGPQNSIKSGLFFRLNSGGNLLISKRYTASGIPTDILALTDIHWRPSGGLFVYGMSNDGSQGLSLPFIGKVIPANGTMTARRVDTGLPLQQWLTARMDLCPDNGFVLSAISRELTTPPTQKNWVMKTPPGNPIPCISQPYTPATQPGASVAVSATGSQSISNNAPSSVLSFVTSPFHTTPATLCASCHIDLSMSPLPDTVCQGDTLYLNCQVQGAHHVRWEAGTNWVSAQAVDSFYVGSNLAGQVVFTLQAKTPDSSCQKRLQDTVYIMPLPVLDPAAIASSMDMRRDIAQFNGIGANVSTWFWDFGDGTTSTLQAPLHPFPDFDSTYTVTVRGKNGICADSAAFLVKVDCPPPVADFDAVCTQNTCCIENKTMSDCKVVSYLWDYGDGTTDTAQDPLPHTYLDSVPSWHTVTLTVWTAYDSSQTYHLVRTGGIYSTTNEILGKRRRNPLYEVPPSWLTPMNTYPGDQDTNKIEDSIQNSPNALFNILIMLDQYNTVSLSHWDSLGKVEFIGRYIPVVALDSVQATSLSTIALMPRVLMIIDNKKRPVLTRDTTMHVHGILSSTWGNYLNIQDNLSGPVGERTLIAILDTGINEGYPGLGKAKVREGICFDATRDMRVNPADDEGHGTLVASLAAGGRSLGDFRPGVAPWASLVDVKVVDSLGMARPSDIIRGIEHTIELGEVDVLVLPISIPLKSDGHDPVAESVNAAVESGICVVTPTGNHLGGIRSPGRAGRAITVANLDFVNLLFPGDDTVCGLLGPTGSPQSASSNANPAFGVGACGLQMYKRAGATLEDIQISGSSFSAAIAGGAVAVILSRHPELNPEEVYQLLMASSRNATWNNVTGKGAMDLYQALNHLAVSQPVNIGFSHPLDSTNYHSPDINTSHFEGLTLSDTGHYPVSIAIRNYGNTAVEGAVLHLTCSRYGTYDEKIPLATINLPSLSPGTNTIVAGFWPPFDMDAICLRAELSHPLDTSRSDNEARTNRRAITRQPEYLCTEYQLIIGNWSMGAQQVTLALTDSLPPCWEVEFENGGNITIQSGTAWHPTTVRICLDSTCCDSIQRELNRTQSGDSLNPCCLDSILADIMIITDGWVASCAAAHPMTRKDGVIATTFNTCPSWLCSRVAEIPVGLEVFPNPALEQILIRTTGLAPGSVELTVRNLHGVTVLRDVLRISTDHTQTHPLFIGELPAGVYLLTLRGKRFEKTLRFVKL